MRFGRILKHVPGLSMIRPRKISGNICPRFYVFLVFAICCIFVYVVCTTQDSLKLPAGRQLCTSRYGGFGADRGRQNTSGDTSEQQSSASVSRRTPGIAPVKCDPRSLVSEVLRLSPIKFLPNFKNPCWHEPVDTPITDIYAQNGFAKYSSNYEKDFNKRIDAWLNQDTNMAYRLRCLPYFFLAGQPKCGSTDFYNRIVSHPDITSPPIKESHWWGKNRYGWCLNYTETIPFKDYVDLYDGAAMHIDKVVNKTPVDEDQYHPVITGDASVSTLWSNDDWWKNPENCGRMEPRFTNADHVHFVLPQARIIVILRNPTDRLYSDFLFFRHSSKSQDYFHREVSYAIDIFNDCILRVGIRSCVYNSTIASSSRVRLRLGLYQVYLQEWLALFPRNQVFVVRLEDYSERPVTIIKQVHQFLNLRSLSGKEHKILMDKPLLNTRRESDRRLGVMHPETRALLDTFYRPYNAELATLLGDDGYLWANT